MHVLMHAHIFIYVNFATESFKEEVVLHHLCYDYFKYTSVFRVCFTSRLSKS